MNVMNLTYDSINYYLVQSNSGWIMIDTGWPGTLSKLLALLKQNNVRIDEIKYLIITHFHPDHAGLVQEIKDFGAALVLHECQVDYIGELKAFFHRKPKYKFKDIDSKNNIVVSSAESRLFLEKIGIKGGLIQTLGHSDDSISLVIDECCAFTGDLPGFFMFDEESKPELKESWAKIKEHQVKTIYPAHGYSFSL